MKSLKIIYIFTLLSLIPHVQAQTTTNASSQTTIPVYNFTQFEPFLHPVTSDTTYVINFWATWCAPCIKELPYFEQIHTKYASQRVKVILVSLDFKNQIESRVIPFVRQRNIQSEVLVLSDPDANAWINKVDPNWSGALPATIVMKGDKREFHEKAFSSDELESLITKYIAL